MGKNENNEIELAKTNDKKLLSPCFPKFAFH